MAQRRLGVRIRTLRIRRSWSQQQLATKAKVHPSFVGQVERCEKGIRLSNLLRLCVALEVDPADLFRGLLLPEQPARERK